MAIKKNTRAKKTLDPPSDMVTIRKSPRGKLKSTSQSSAGETTPSRKPRKEPVKRNRKKKTDDDDNLPHGNGGTKPSKNTKGTPQVLVPGHTPLLSPDSLRNTLISINGTTVTEQEILAATDSLKLMRLLEKLITTEQDVIFDQYRQTSRTQMDRDRKKIALLEDEVQRQQATIVSLQEQLLGNGNIVSTPKKRETSALYESPIRKSSSSSLMIHQEELANELKTIGITLDMLELLTGVRITNYEEDKVKFYFDVKQSSTNMDNDVDTVCVVYRLIIKKKFELTAEVTFVPTFLQDAHDENAQRVSKHLPDYFRDNLIFPYNTLLQFYTKMNKALNKSAKD